MKRSQLAHLSLIIVLLVNSDVSARIICKRIRNRAPRRQCVWVQQTGQPVLAQQPNAAPSTDTIQQPAPKDIGKTDLPAVPTVPEAESQANQATGEKPKAGPVGLDLLRAEPDSPTGDLAAPKHLFIHNYEVHGPGFLTGVTYRNDREEGPEESESVDLIVLRPVDGGWDVVHRVKLPADDKPAATQGLAKYQFPTPLAVEKGYVFAHWQAVPRGPIPLNLDEAKVEGHSSGKFGFASGDVQVGDFIAKTGFMGQRDYFINVEFRPAGKHKATGTNESPPLLAVLPFDSAKAGELQLAWAKVLGVSAEIKDSIGMKLRLIPPGKFYMGPSREEVENLLQSNTVDRLMKEKLREIGPQRDESISQAYYMAEHEVTRGQFAEFVKATGYITTAEKDGKGGHVSRMGRWERDPKRTWKGGLGFAQQDDHPAVVVSRSDAQAFCRWLSKKAGVQYKLPTEVQWEFACRSGNSGQFDFGHDVSLLPQHAWFAGNASMRTHPVGGKLPNAFGLYDMHGNAWEWCADKDQENSDAGRLQIARGGAFDMRAESVRSSHGTKLRSDFSSFNNGFRVARVVDPTLSGASEVGNGEETANPLQGAWQMSKYKFGDGDRFTEMPKTSKHIKVIAGGRFIWTTVRDGKVFRSAGGTYRINDDQYTEKVESVLNDTDKLLIGRETTFRYAIEGNTLTISGKWQRGNSTTTMTEVWWRYPAIEFGTP